MPVATRSASKRNPARQKGTPGAQPPASDQSDAPAAKPNQTKTPGTVETPIADDASRNHNASQEKSTPANESQQGALPANPALTANANLTEQQTLSGDEKEDVDAHIESKTPGNDDERGNSNGALTARSNNSNSSSSSSSDQDLENPLNNGAPSRTMTQLDYDEDEESVASVAALSPSELAAAESLTPSQRANGPEAEILALPRFRIFLPKVYTWDDSDFDYYHIPKLSSVDAYERIILRLSDFGPVPLGHPDNIDGVPMPYAVPKNWSKEYFPILDVAVIQKRFAAINKKFRLCFADNFILLLLKGRLFLELKEKHRTLVEPVVDWSSIFRAELMRLARSSAVMHLFSREEEFQHFPAFLFRNAYYESNWSLYQGKTLDELLLDDADREKEPLCRVACFPRHKESGTTLWSKTIHANAVKGRGAFHDGALRGRLPRNTLGHIDLVEFIWGNHIKSVIGMLRPWTSLETGIAKATYRFVAKHDHLKMTYISDAALASLKEEDPNIDRTIEFPETWNVVRSTGDYHRKCKELCQAMRDEMRTKIAEIEAAALHAQEVTLQCAIYIPHPNDTDEDLDLSEDANKARKDADHPSPLRQRKRKEKGSGAKSRKKQPRKEQQPKPKANPNPRVSDKDEADANPEVSALQAVLDAAHDDLHREGNRLAEQHEVAKNPSAVELERQRRELKWELTQKHHYEITSNDNVKDDTLSRMTYQVEGVKYARKATQMLRHVMQSANDAVKQDTGHPAAPKCITVMEMAFVNGVCCWWTYHGLRDLPVRIIKTMVPRLSDANARRLIEHGIAEQFKMLKKRKIIDATGARRKCWGAFTNLSVAAFGDTERFRQSARLCDLTKVQAEYLRDIAYLSRKVHKQRRPEDRRRARLDLIDYQRKHDTSDLPDEVLLDLSIAATHGAWSKRRFFSRVKEERRKIHGYRSPSPPQSLRSYNHSRRSSNRHSSHRSSHRSSHHSSHHSSHRSSHRSGHHSPRHSPRHHSNSHSYRHESSKRSHRAMGGAPSPQPTKRQRISESGRALDRSDPTNKSEEHAKATRDAQQQRKHSLQQQSAQIRGTTAELNHRGPDRRHLAESFDEDPALQADPARRSNPELKDKLRRIRDLPNRINGNTEAFATDTNERGERTFSQTSALGREHGVFVKVCTAAVKKPTRTVASQQLAKLENAFDPSTAKGGKKSGAATRDACVNLCQGLIPFNL